jgi:hypothetical protein
VAVTARRRVTYASIGRNGSGLETPLDSALLRGVRLKTATLLVLLVAPLAACGGKGPLTNGQLADQVTKTFKAQSPYVCWTHGGYLKFPFDHRYDHVCGVSRTVSQIYLVVEPKKRSWCVVTPRVKNVPLCKIF